MRYRFRLYLITRSPIARFVRLSVFLHSIRLIQTRIADSFVRFLRFADLFDSFANSDSHRHI